MARKTRFDLDTRLLDRAVRNFSLDNVLFLY